VLYFSCQTLNSLNFSHHMSPHPKRSHARILLTSVFGPYAQDDSFGSRKINPMELYHNQVTRMQGAFSLRMFHRSWGLMLIQANISAPCTLLDFPTRERFVEEIRENDYDVVGISAIQTNVLKVAEMCRLIREHLPGATIVVGGHVANMPALRSRIDADHIVLGEGVRWFRKFLGEDENLPIRHPRVYAGHGSRMMGVDLREDPGDIAATLIPSVGCPMGCNFCATSAMFGGKGRFVNFYETGDELFEVMVDLERELRTQSFFVMDENFLFHRKRALRLLELMRQHGKTWSLYVFSSARVLQSYPIEDLVGLGISWVWMGLEGENSRYGKLQGVDTRELVDTLQSHGIRVLGSSIIGLDEHTPENIDGVIEYAVRHDTDFHQFMLYTPLGGTPLFQELKERGALLDPECENAPDHHGQLRFAHRHPHIPAGLETEVLRKAVVRDFEVNGPSVVRLVRTLLRGYLRYKNSPDARVRARFAYEARDLKGSYAAALWAAARWYRSQPAIHVRITATLEEIYREFGWRARVAAWAMGLFIYHKLRAEHRRLQNGFTYEPGTVYEKTHQPVDDSDAASQVAQPIRVREGKIARGKVRRAPVATAPR
jgi:radical SAM superfamily enzyme YgiQ (UPF0313 family)